MSRTEDIVTTLALIIGGGIIGMLIGREYWFLIPLALVLFTMVYRVTQR